VSGAASVYETGMKPGSSPPRLSLLTGALLILASATGARAQDPPLPSEPPLPVAAPPPPVPPAIARKARLEVLTTETTEALGLLAAPDEPAGRLFLVEKRGKVRILRGKKIDATPFLDLTGKVSLEPRDNGEQGLLGLAFHPGYAQNGRFYLNFTDPKGHTRVVERKVDATSPDRADSAFSRELLMVEQPYANHNAGDLGFGPDGKLYVLLGDGGAGDDPQNFAQNPQSRLGKALRLDVDAAQASVEVVGKGLRNPWRYSFDSKTKDLYIADIGQRQWEYIHLVPGGKLAGQNFGWRIVEGKHCFMAKTCNKRGLHAPVLEYNHREGCSITGGHVYRGKALPELDGHYFYSDYCTAILRSFRIKGGRVTDHWDWKAALDPEFKLARIASFGTDQDGELYLVSHEGPVYKLVAR
jgi:glucose/arabinose dehydrogenase